MTLNERLSSEVPFFLGGFDFNLEFATTQPRSLLQLVLSPNLIKTLSGETDLLASVIGVSERQEYKRKRRSSDDPVWPWAIGVALSAAIQLCGAYLVFRGLSFPVLSTGGWFAWGF